MITVIRNPEGQITEVTSEYRAGGENRNDWKTFAKVQEVAADVTAFTKAAHIAVDNGPHHHPRFDVARLPAVGDEVSYAFNGDSYPCGKVASVSKTHKLITTTEGQKFYRRDTRASWVMNGTWSLVQGHSYTQNPSF
jgi:hypothetical protein